MEHDAVIQEGPIDGRLLVFQKQHRSHVIWANNGESPVDCKTVVARRNEGNLKKLEPPAAPVAQLVRQAGFGGLLDIPFISLDLALVTALLERWRPETHTFHSGSGEWTVTLQDVEVLLALPVDGLPVVGSTNQNWIALCAELLGRSPNEKNDMVGAKVKLSWLRDHFDGSLPVGYSPEQVRQQARGIILQVIGGMLIPDHSGSYVHLCFLSLLRDLTVQHSWGGACLSGLYHFLCHASKAGNNNVGGCFILLQLWAWERFPWLAPGLCGKQVRPPGSPLGARWHDAFHSPDLTPHVLGAYRHFFDLQKPNEVRWTPYDDELIESLPLNCRGGRHIWMAKVPLICFPYVENHMPDRVMRQFGYRQTIPEACNCRAEVPHGKTFKGGTDFRRTYDQWIRLWENRLIHIVPPRDEDITVYPIDDPYVVWYNTITVRYISRLGAAADTAMGLFERLTTMDVTDIEEVRRIGVQGVKCMGYMEKWLRKKAPMQPSPVVFGPMQGEQLQDGGQEPVAEDEIHPQEAHEEIHPQEAHYGHPQEAEDVGSSFESHIQGLENFALTPLLDSMTPSSNPPTSQSQIPIDPSWFDESPVINAVGVQTNLFDVPVVKRRKRTHGDERDSVGDDAVTQLRAYAFGLHDHPSNEVQEEVQVVGEKDDGVVTQKDTQPTSEEAQATLHTELLEQLQEEAHVALHAEVSEQFQEEAQVAGQGNGEVTQEDGSPSLAQRRTRRHPHPPDCGTGGSRH